MDIKTEQGVTHNTETGKSQVPNNLGGVSEETRQKMVEMFGPNVVVMSKDVYEKVVASVGAQAEDAKSRGLNYQPKLTERFTNLAKQNLNITGLFVAVAVGAGVVYVARKGGQLLARKMGWNLFGNVVMLDVQGEQIGVRREPRARHITPSTPAASA